jgi:hypothetical protein
MVAVTTPVMIPVINMASMVMIAVTTPVAIPATGVLSPVVVFVIVVLGVPFLVMFFLPAVVLFLPTFVQAGMFPLVIPVREGGKRGKYQGRGDNCGQHREFYFVHLYTPFFYRFSQRVC